MLSRCCARAISGCCTTVRIRDVVKWSRKKLRKKNFHSLSASLTATNCVIMLSPGTWWFDVSFMFHMQLDRETTIVSKVVARELMQFSLNLRYNPIIPWNSRCRVSREAPADVWQFHITDERLSFFFICKSLLHESPISKTNPWSTISHKFIQIAHFFLELRLQLDQSSVYESRRVSLSFLHALLKKFSLFFFFRSRMSVSVDSRDIFRSFNRHLSPSFSSLRSTTEKRERKLDWVQRARRMQNILLFLHLARNLHKCSSSSSRDRSSRIERSSSSTISSHSYARSSSSALESERQSSERSFFFFSSCYRLLPLNIRFFSPFQLGCVLFFSLKVFYLSTKKTSSRNS